MTMQSSTVKNVFGYLFKQVSSRMIEVYLISNDKKTNPINHAMTIQILIEPNVRKIQNITLQCFL